MLDETLELLAPKNNSQYESELAEIELDEREADQENELEHVEAGLGFYKLSK